MPKTKKKYDGFTVMLLPSLIKEISVFALKIKSTRSQLMRKWIIEGYVKELLSSKKIRNKA